MQSVSSARVQILKFLSVGRYQDVSVGRLRVIRIQRAASELPDARLERRLRFFFFFPSAAT